MSPESRKVWIKVVAFLVGLVAVIIGIVLDPPKGRGGEAMTGYAIRGGMTMMAGAGFGALAAILFLPRAQVTCPKCGNPNAKPEGVYFVSGFGKEASLYLSRL